MRLLLLVITMSLLGGCASIKLSERTFIRPDSPAGANSTATFDQAALQALLPSARIETLQVAQSDGAIAHGIAVRQPGARSTVLYFGGNVFHIDRHAKVLVPRIAACPVNVVIFDYRGYGRSSGAPTIALMASDALTIFDHVNAQFPGQVVVHGQSLGSFVAAHVARQRPARALVLEATVTNVQDWAEANVPWYVRPFVTISMSPQLAALDNVAAVSAYRGRGMVLAGGRDRITPARLGKAVYAALPGEPKTLLISDQAGHNDILEHRDAGQAYCDFLAQLEG